MHELLKNFSVQKPLEVKEEHETDDISRIKQLHTSIMQHMIEFIARYIKQKADFDITVQTNESRIKEMAKKYEIMQEQAKTFQEDLIRHGLQKFD